MLVFSMFFHKKPGFDELLKRFHEDAQFRSQLETDFETAVRPYKLTPEERRTVQQNIEKKRENYAEKVIRDIWNKYKDQF